jgi:hypothetical protein
MTDMWTTNRVRLAMAVLLAAGTACGDDDDDGGTEPATEFEAQLSGDEEVPPVETPASGSATISVEDGQIVYRVEVEDLENAFVSHIHVEAPGANGPVRMNLCGTGAPLPACQSGTGVLAEGTNSTTEGGITFDSLVSAIRAGNAYVNVHTTDGVEPPNTGPGDFPGGEIRGQLTAQ